MCWITYLEKHIDLRDCDSCSGKDQQKQIDQQLQMQPLPQFASSLFKLVPFVLLHSTPSRHDQFLRQEEMRKRNNMELEEDIFHHIPVNDRGANFLIVRDVLRTSIYPNYVEEKRRTLQEQARLDREATIVRILELQLRIVEVSTTTKDNTIECLRLHNHCSSGVLCCCRFADTAIYLLILNVDCASLCLCHFKISNSETVGTPS